MVITNQDIIDAWSKVDQKIIENHGDEGDFSRQYLLNPALFSLVDNVKDRKILDAGCGQGYLCRKLAKKGAYVTGVEPALGLLDYAQKREQEESLGITYIQADLSTWKSLSNNFDIVIANMVLMDIPDFKSAMKNCIDALKKGGSFIFSILHPCFEEDIMWSEQPYVKVEEYLREYTKKNIVSVSFHRTLSTYINLIIENNCQIKKIIEPQLSDELALKFVRHTRDNHVPSFLIMQAIKQ